jgi:hypothetical protein
MVISYEALCFDPETVLRQVCNKAGAEFNPQMTDLTNSKAHIGLGNPMRTHDVKSRKIVYDYRWFYQLSAHLIYFLPRIRKYNEKMMNSSLIFDPKSRLFEPKKEW